MKLIVIQILLLVASIGKSQQYFDTIFLTSGALNFRYQIESVGKHDIYFTTSTGTTGSVSRDKVVRYVWQADPEIPFSKLESGEIGWTDIVEAPGLSKSDIYTKVRIWFSESFKSSNHVLQMDDKDSGIIIGKGNTRISGKGGIVGFDYVTDFTIKIEIKDGRYRSTISDISFPIMVHPYGTVTLEEMFKRDPPVTTKLKNIKIALMREIFRLKTEVSSIVGQESLSSDW